jgi:hypothetical protein
MKQDLISSEQLIDLLQGQILGFWVEKVNQWDKECVEN